MLSTCVAAPGRFSSAGHGAFLIMELLTAEQVISLAPDTSSVKAGQGLANPGKWLLLGRDERSVWGECQGSGKNPYRTQADLSGPAFHCSCPSRKFPCKHGLGLLLLLARDSGKATGSSAPPWVGEWIAKRDASAEKKAAKTDGEEASDDPNVIAKRAVEREKRAVKREDRVRAGFQELQIWLGDLARQGLVQAKQQPAQFFDAMAARMIDAQAPGVARRLREWPGIFASREDWAGQALTEMGRLQWLAHGFSRIDSLPEEMRATVRSEIGWTIADADLSTAEAVRDRWQVVGQVVEEEGKLRVQRTWLVGEVSRRHALCLSFAAENQPLDVSLVPGTVLDADLIFYPSAAPLRAVVRERHGPAQAFAEAVSHANYAEALDQTSVLLAGDPWLERTPWLVGECVSLRDEDSWHLRDAHGDSVPIARSFTNGWPLFALSGGSTMTVFGEWNGRELMPLSVIAEGRFVSVGGALV